MSEEENVGFFYNWYAVNDERGLAPEGFHVPDLEEMNKLLNFLSPDNCGLEIKKVYVYDDKRRKKSSMKNEDYFWESPTNGDSPVHNSTGLSILNTGSDDLFEFFDDIGDSEALKRISEYGMANFWMTNKNDSDKSYSWHLRDCVNEDGEAQADEGGFGAFRIDSDWNKNCFFAVRLIKD